MSQDHEPTEQPDADDQIVPEESIPDEKPVDSKEPFALEPTLTESLDVCPNCGASMENVDTLVCLRCGYDFQAMRVIETVSEAEPADGDDEEVDDVQDTNPIVVSGLGGWHLPIVVAVIAISALVIGCLAGYHGLFPELIDSELESQEMVEWGYRFEAIGRMVALMSLWTICGIAALFVCSWMFGRPFGDARLALFRMLAMVTVARTLTFVSLGGGALERIVELLGEAALFTLLTMILMRMRPRDAATMVGIMIIGFVTLFGLSHFVVWVT